MRTSLEDVHTGSLHYGCELVTNNSTLEAAPLECSPPVIPDFPDVIVLFQLQRPYLSICVVQLARAWTALGDGHTVSGAQPKSRKLEMNVDIECLRPRLWVPLHQAHKASLSPLTFRSRRTCFSFYKWRKRLHLQ
jgi:hypothetical protein